MPLIGIKFRKEDIPTRVSWINDPKVFYSMHFDSFVTEEGTEDWYERNRACKDRIDVSFLEDDRIVAMGGLTSISDVHRNAELYVLVGPAFHRRGYGSESTKWLVNYGFSQLGLHRIYLITNGTNDAAVALYRKLGFVQEGVLREHKWLGDRFIDRILFGMNHSEWRVLPWSSIVQLQEN